MMMSKKKRFFGIALVILLLLLSTSCYSSQEAIDAKVEKETTTLDDGKASNEEKVEEGKPEEITESITDEKIENTCTHEMSSEEKWKYAKYATPFESGERYKHCIFCKAVLSESYTIPTMENNSIYIVGTDINDNFTISSFTQDAIDKYDIVYSEDSKLGSNNPFVLGHNYRTLGKLYQTEVGEHIYVYVNENVEIYEVIVSEYGLQNSSWNDIIGQTTGTSIWKEYDCKTLHLYTCYGINKNGRWIVLAKKIF